MLTKTLMHFILLVATSYALQAAEASLQTLEPENKAHEGKVMLQPLSERGQKLKRDFERECKNLSGTYPIMAEIPQILPSYEASLNNICNICGKADKPRANKIMRVMMQLTLKALFQSGDYDRLELFSAPYADVNDIPDVCMKPKIPTTTDKSAYINHNVTKRGQQAVRRKLRGLTKGLLKQIKSPTE